MRPALAMLLLLAVASALNPQRAGPLRMAAGSGSGEPRKAGWLPGATAPAYLDGSLAGDVGFDPLCLVPLARTSTSMSSSGWKSVDRPAQMVMMSEYEQRRKVMWMREAEVKHARLAMVAAAGWPMSELLDAPVSKILGLPYALEETGGRAPSLFNGHLFEGPQAYFLLIATLATATLELSTLDNVEGLTPTGYVPGDLGFDPANLREARPQMDLAEIKHGRLAMLAITGFAVQEAIYGVPVIDQTPQFFHPFGFF